MVIVTTINLLLGITVEYIYTNEVLDDVLFFTTLPEIVLLLLSIVVVVYVLREKINKKYLVMPIVYFFGFVIYLFYLAVIINHGGIFDTIGDAWIVLIYLFSIIYSIYLLKSKTDDTSHLAVAHKKINPWLIILILTVLISIPMIFYLLNYFGTFDNFEAPKQKIVAEEVKKQEIEWKEFTSIKGNFKVEFPAKVLHDSYVFGFVQRDTTMEANTYYVDLDDDEVSFFIDFYKYPEDEEIPESDILMQEMVDSMDTHPIQEVVFSEFGQFKDFRTLSLSLRVGNDMEEGEIFVVGDTIYIIGRYYSMGDYDEEMYERFRQSFEILKNPE